VPAPADYTPLSPEESQTLRELFAKATLGVRLIVPDPQSPANWLGEFWLSSAPHMGELQRLAATHPGASHLITYDPREQR
jgi:hypothetical protein